MSNDTVVSLAAPAPVSDPLTKLLRSGARWLIEAAVSAEFEEFRSAFGHEKLPETQALHCPLKRGNSRNGATPLQQVAAGTYADSLALAA